MNCGMIINYNVSQPDLAIEAFPTVIWLVKDYTAKDKALYYKALAQHEPLLGA